MVLEAFFFSVYSAVEIMNVTGQIQDPSMTLQIQVGNVECLRRPCSMYQQKTELNFGVLRFHFISFCFLFS